MRYGFRVHKLELARGLSGRRRLEPKTCTNDSERAQVAKGLAAAVPPVDYLDNLVEQLETLRSSPDTLTDVPRLIAVADGSNEFVPSEDPGTPRLTVEKVVVSGRRVHVDVEYGHLGWHHRAVGAQRSDRADLTKRSPMQPYRLEFLVPSEGVTGLIASETISGGHALPMLVAWLNHLSRVKHGDDDMVRLMAHALTDLQRVLTLLERPNAVAEIELKRPGGVATTDGAPTSGKITLKEQLVPGTKIEAIKLLLTKWHEAGFKYDEDGMRKQVRALASIVDPEAGDLEFTDGVIRLDSGTGRNLSVRPSKLGELYSFDISDRQPDSRMWEERVKEQILGFATDQELSVVWG